jgi:excisionase family DNA binding protein
MITRDSVSPSTVSAVKTREAAERLSVTPKTIRSLVARGLLRPNRATRHLLFPVAELDRFLNESSYQEPAKARPVKPAEHNLGTLA